MVWRSLVPTVFMDPRLNCRAGSEASNPGTHSHFVVCLSARSSVRLSVTHAYIHDIHELYIQLTTFTTFCMLL